MPSLNFPVVYILRAVQAAFAIIVIGLIGHVMDKWVGGHLDSANFMLFNGVWTFFIVVPYLVLAPIFVPVIAHRFAVAAVDGITMLFWFAGFIALAADLPNASYCSDFGVCRELQAATAFGAFEWALFVATTVLGVLAALRKDPNSSSPQPPTATVP